MRRLFLATSWVTAAFLFSGAASSPLTAVKSRAPLAQTSAKDNLKVTLLGTGGGPPVDLQRFGASTLVETATQRLLFDCGRGAIIRLTELGKPLGSITKLFLTHLHSDHIVDIPDLLLSPWGAGERRVPLEVWGPSGTVEMMDGLQKAFTFDIRVRSPINNENQEGIKVLSHDIKEGVVFDREGLKVTAFLVDHGPDTPAYGFRVDYAGHSVALSGDTRVSENLIRAARGVDVLIHEVVDEGAFQRLSRERRERILALHTTAEQAGQVFSRVKPRLAVYSHAVGEPQKIIARTRTTYSGPLESGDDLMTIDISDHIDVQHVRR